MMFKSHVEPRSLLQQMLEDPGRFSRLLINVDRSRESKCPRRGRFISPSKIKVSMIGTNFALFSAICRSSWLPAADIISIKRPYCLAPCT